MPRAYKPQHLREAPAPAGLRLQELTHTTRSNEPSGTQSKASPAESAGPTSRVSPAASSRWTRPIDADDPRDARALRARGDLALPQPTSMIAGASGRDTQQDGCSWGQMAAAGRRYCAPSTRRHPSGCGLRSIDRESNGCRSSDVTPHLGQHLTCTGAALALSPLRETLPRMTRPIPSDDYIIAKFESSRTASGQVVGERRTTTRRSIELAGRAAPQRVESGGSQRCSQYSPAHDGSPTRCRRRGAARNECLDERALLVRRASQGRCAAADRATVSKKLLRAAGLWPSS